MKCCLDRASSRFYAVRTVLISLFFTAGKLLVFCLRGKLYLSSRSVVEGFVSLRSCALWLPRSTPHGDLFRSSRSTLFLERPSLRNLCSSPSSLSLRRASLAQFSARSSFACATVPLECYLLHVFPGAVAGGSPARLSAL